MFNTPNKTLLKSLGKISIKITLAVLLLGCSPPAPAATDKPQQPIQPPTAQTSQGQQLPLSAKLKIGEQTLLLEVARTPEQQRIGLMYRSSVPDDRGMLFPFDPPRPVTFWMKNVSIHLDMVFLRDGQIKAIESQVPPCQTTNCPVYGPETTEIDQVLELRSRRAAELGLKVGDKLEIEFFDPSTTFPSPGSNKSL